MKRKLKMDRKVQRKMQSGNLEVDRFTLIERIALNRLAVLS
ncbi:hypothetical protein A5844_000503 [Enterococcus sp. 10A9_DIV0425]|uniref:Uncharacterized protein n=1 Tax=Candidatus Enterococcus wittei TaxID=1987383 RepID=A0A2C9XQ24_9ENTE|nr:hypothetical protein A5844_000503 [Enterococcus sp. 10A9_DIV0425]